MTASQYLEARLAGAPDDALRDLIVELNMEIIQAHVASVPDLLERWRALNGASRLRLAGCPFLLVDAGFGRSECWAKLPSFGVNEALPLRTLLANRSVLPTPLLRRVLLLAWHMARVNRTGARIALGMSGSCVGVVAGCRLPDLELLAERRPGWIRPRWDQHAPVWRAWLSAAEKESSRGLERLHLWGLQVVAAELRRPWG